MCLAQKLMTISSLIEKMKRRYTRGESGSERTERPAGCGVAKQPSVICCWCGKGVAEKLIRRKWPL